MRNGKISPSTANVIQSCSPMRTNAARRSDWTKSSLLSVAVTAPERPRRGSKYALSDHLLCRVLFLTTKSICNVHTRPSTKNDDEEDDQNGSDIGNPGAQILDERQFTVQVSSVKMVVFLLIQQ